MSPRAASRLESLGFREVYDYVAGEADWFASGQPMEGSGANLQRAGSLARRDVPTCHLEERLRLVAERVAGTGWDVCPVIDTERVVLGLLHWDELDGDHEVIVEERMESGPSTFRPDTTPEQPLAYMRRHDLGSALVTTSDGRLVGLLTRADTERAVVDGQG